MANVSVISDVSIPSFEEILEYTWDQAKNVFANTGGQPPMFFVYLQNSVVLYDVSEEFQTQEGVGQISLLMHEYGSRQQAQAIVFAGSSYLVDASDMKGDLDLCRQNGVAGHPKSREILYVSVETRNDILMRYAEILRDSTGDLQGFGESETLNGGVKVGSLSGFFTIGEA